MKLISLAALFLGFTLLASMSANAATVRFPQTGDPALVVICPDDWTAYPGGATGMEITAGDASASVVLELGPYTGKLDDLVAIYAKGLAASPPQNKGPTEISGYRGFTYDSVMTNDKGYHISLHFIAVMLDEGHAAVVALESLDTASADQYAAARNVLNSVTLTRANP